MMDLFRLHRDEPKSWTVMPLLLDRIRDFCLRMDTDTEPEEAASCIRAWFIMGDPKLGLWISTEDSKIIGHLWATPEPIGAEQWKYVLIRQAEVDRGYNTMPITEQAFQQVIDWTKSIGLKKVRMITHRNWRSMRRRWGFEPFKIMMDLDFK